VQQCRKRARCGAGHEKRICHGGHGEMAPLP
jgi:hypothetical protein